MKLTIALTCIETDLATLAPAGAVEWLLRLELGDQPGQSFDQTLSWDGNQAVATLDEPGLSRVLVVPRVLDHAFWPSTDPLIFGVTRVGWDLLATPAHFAPVQAVATAGSAAGGLTLPEFSRFIFRHVVSRARLATREVLDRLKHRPLVSVFGADLLPDGLTATGAHVAPSDPAAVDVELPSHTLGEVLGRGSPLADYPDLRGDDAGLPMVTDTILSGDPLRIDRAPAPLMKFVSFAMQLTFMRSPAMLGVAFPEALFDCYPTKEEAAAGKLRPLHVHFAWDPVGFWNFGGYPFADTPPEKWSYDFLSNNLYRRMNYFRHPIRPGKVEASGVRAGRFPKDGNRNEPLLWHDVRRAGQGLTIQWASAGKPCVLIAPVLGLSGETDADELFEIGNLKRMVAEVQGAFYRLRKQYGPLRPLGNISISTVSGGMDAARSFLRWSLGKPPLAGKPAAGSDEIAPRFREAYLFDPDNGGPNMAETMALAKEWRQRDPKRVLRVYHQLGFGNGVGDASEMLFGQGSHPLPNVPGVRRSADGRVTYVVVDPVTFQASREDVIPALPGVPKPQLPGLYGLPQDASEFHVAFANYFLAHALRNSHHTDEP